MSKLFVAFDEENNEIFGVSPKPTETFQQRVEEALKEHYTDDTMKISGSIKYVNSSTLEFIAAGEYMQENILLKEMVVY